MDILQGAIGLLGQLGDVTKTWIAIVLLPEILAVLVGLVVAVGTAEGLKKAPFMQRRESAERRRARTWWLRLGAFLTGVVFTALLWPGDIATKIGVGVATGFSAPLAYDIRWYIAGKLGAGK